MSAESDGLNPNAQPFPGPGNTNATATTVTASALAAGIAQAATSQNRPGLLASAAVAGPILAGTVDPNSSRWPWSATAAASSGQRAPFTSSSYGAAAP